MSFQLRTPFNWILMNLVFTDFAMMSIALPMDFVAVVLGGWKLGKVACVAVGLISTITGGNKLRFSERFLVILLCQILQVLRP